MKHDFSEYSREQLYQIIENKDAEVEYWYEKLNYYLTTFSILLFIFIVCIFSAWLL